MVNLGSEICIFLTKILHPSEELFVAVRADLSELNFFLLLFFNVFKLVILGILINLLGDLVEKGEDAGGESAPEGDKDLLDGGQALRKVKLRRGLSGGLLLLEGLSQVLELYIFDFFPDTWVRFNLSLRQGTSISQVVVSAAEILESQNHLSIVPVLIASVGEVLEAQDGLAVGPVLVAPLSKVLEVVCVNNDVVLWQEQVLEIKSIVILVLLHFIP